MITSPATRVFLTRLIQELEHAGCCPILLRNHETFPDEIGNDLDIYIRPERLSHAFSILSSCASSQQGMIGHIHRRGYFVAIWLRFPDCNEPVHIDLYHGALTWHGLHFLDAQEFVQKSQPAVSSCVYQIPSPCHEALISLLASILWGGFFKSRYQKQIAALLADQEQSRAFTNHLEQFFGRKGAELAAAVARGEAATLVDSAFSRKLRRNLFAHSLKTKPLASAIAWLHHWFEEFACYGWRLPGMVVEYDSAAWAPDDLEKFQNRLSAYFGDTHENTQRPSLNRRLKIQRLRGKNHLILLSSDRFTINHQTYFASAEHTASIAGEALEVLARRIKYQHTLR
ncbi:MAG: hypothetical protein NWT08_00950 [Akkermansiaceae bacterium]|nr:hypothetical protein [Akkermansiaceae bacterium]MDP4846967.1 hypothetical protein [Akkermansiaceae bacterium]